MDIQYVKAMINMDMLGVPMGKKNKNPFITGYQLSDLPSILNQELFQSNPGLYGKEYFKRDPFYKEHLFSRSDNLWFAMQGIPAHTIIATSSTNQYYHSLNDEPGTLDYNNLSAIIKALVLGSVGIIAGTQTPGRLQVDKINNY
jgi:Zn-dependent M28 family amino/carboxypeptidase